MMDRRKEKRFLGYLYEMDDAGRKDKEQGKKDLVEEDRDQGNKNGSDKDKKKSGGDGKNGGRRRPTEEFVHSIMNATNKKADLSSPDELVRSRSHSRQLIGQWKKLCIGEKTPQEYLLFTVNLLLSDKSKLTRTISYGEGADVGKKEDKNDLSPRKQIYDLFYACGLKDRTKKNGTTEKPGLLEAEKQIKQVLIRKDAEQILKKNGYLTQEKNGGHRVFTKIKELHDAILEVSSYYAACDKLDYWSQEDSIDDTAENDGGLATQHKSNSSGTGRRTGGRSGMVLAMEQIIGNMKADQGVEREEEDDSGLSDQIRRWMGFLSVNWGRLSPKTFIPVDIDRVTGCGVYILGNIYFNEKKDAHQAHMVIMQPKFKGSLTKENSIFRSSNYESIALELCDDNKNIYDNDVKNGDSDNLEINYEADKRVVFQTLIIKRNDLLNKDFLDVEDENYKDNFMKVLEQMPNDFRRQLLRNHQHNLCMKETEKQDLEATRNIGVKTRQHIQ